MNMDFHVHGILSKKLKFNEELFLQGIEFAKNNMLDGFVLCEHFNAVDIDSSFSFLEDNFLYENDRYDVNGFYVYTAMEVDIKYGGHVIVCGNRENIYKIKDYLHSHKKKADFVYFEDLLDMAEENKCMTIGSHPYRENHKLYLQSEKSLKRLDALDLNSKDIYKHGVKNTEKQVKELSKQLAIPYVTGSDSHYPIMLGCVRTCFDEDCLSIDELKDAIRNERFKRVIGSDLKLKIYTAKAAKNYTKKKIKESAEKNSSSTGKKK
ncbi:PHP-associated domain-containing protein [uncultured Clostridium sp.]|uniref:PHP-associated domain-containing protein n=1 Tax=uncultured Clostridium sp. TaxID=59620 RepID=UPI0025EE14FB|nr:PHP-associated domain-containing protein [uncultured Clostridium sp.]